MNLQWVDFLKNIAPFSFFLIFLVSLPGENFLLTIFKVFIVSGVSALIFAYVGYYNISQRGISKPQIPFFSVVIVSVISIPLGLLYNHFSINFILNLQFAELILPMSIIFVAQVGLITWGFEFGVKKFYSNRNLSPTKKTKKLKRMQKELYPNSVDSKQLGNQGEIDDQDM
ncbi:MAG: hypothetical protein GPJ54_19940 [Candidatus Heimdallarchaeota archaeon]|nr:hypothetical protein [Candidatus Heimdallarchaeota archaeon]